MDISVAGVPTSEQERPIIVTAAGKENLVLRCLVRQAIPMLASPEAYPAHERCQLAQTLTAALEIDEGGEKSFDPDDRDAPPEEGYEPGSRLEDPWQ